MDHSLGVSQPDGGDDGIGVPRLVAQYQVDRRRSSVAGVAVAVGRRREFRRFGQRRPCGTEIRRQAAIVVDVFAADSPRIQRRHGRRRCRGRREG